LTERAIATRLSRPTGLRTDRASATRTDALALGAVALALLAWFLWPFLAYDARFPLGPDAPVYLWWARLAGEEGLSVVGHRAGVPALTLTLQGALGRSVVEATAALEIALGVVVGLGAMALVRGRTSRAGRALAGLLTGTYAVHLAAGYLANLAVAAVFIAAAAVLATRARHGVWLAAGLMAAGGLAHPLFFLVSAAILVVTAVLAWHTDRAEVLAVAGATVGGGAVVGMGLLALLVGPAPPDIDTSRDAFLRRAGLGAELRAAYIDRFLHRWTRYVQWASVPVAALGLLEGEGFVGRFLRAWGALLIAGVAVGLATGWFPADRFVTFGFVVPLLASLGLVRLVRWFGRRRAVALVVAGALTVAMLAGAFVAWNRQRPFMSEDEVIAATVANTLVQGLDPGLPIVIVVDDDDQTVSFLATRAGNVIRAAMPPDRIRDVVILVGGHPGDVNAERRALERLTAADLRDAEMRSGRTPEAFILTPFNDPGDDFGLTLATVIRPNEAPLVAGEPDDPLEPMSRAGTVASAVLTLAFLSMVGYGWARVAFADAAAAAATAPAFGTAAVMLAAIALERAGLPIDSIAGAWIVSALAGASGYIAWRVLERRAGARTAPEIDEEPSE
jgi:hypothetical protein